MPTQYFASLLLRRYDYYNQGWWCEALYYPICALFISCLSVDPFLLDQSAFQASLKAPWLQVGAQITRCFASLWRVITVVMAVPFQMLVHIIQGQVLKERWSVCGLKARCMQYAVTVNDPYLSVKVVWLSQDMDDEENSWVYAYCQTDNMCSPWDLQPSKYVHPDYHKLSHGQSYRVH